MCQAKHTSPARLGLLIILSSPSGAGKSTLARRLLEWDAEIQFSVSATTRKPRSGETDGVDYFFLSEDEFQRMVDDGRMLEHAQVFSNRYGSPRGPVEKAMTSGVDVLFDIDWQGAQQITNSQLARFVLSIFLLPPSIEELRSRLESRGQDSTDVIAQRMTNSWDEISHWSDYDYVLVNNDLDATERQLENIVMAERLRRAQQPGLVDHVRRLQTEFEARK